MHETTEQIQELQSLLDRSYAQAGEHLLSIHSPEWRLPAEAVCSVLEKVCILNLATVNAAGHPLVAPVDGLFLHGRFWFGSSQISQRFKHIRANPHVSAAHTRGEEVSILVHGRAHEIDTASGDYERVHEYCLEVYGSGYDGWNLWGKEPYAWIEPARMFAVHMMHD